MADRNNPGQFGNRQDTEEQARKGGQSRGAQSNSNPGNFANDKKKAREAGHKGGQSSHGGGRS